MNELPPITVFGYPRSGNSLLMASLWLTWYRQTCGHYHELRGGHFGDARGNPPPIPESGVVILRQPLAAVRSLWRMRRWWGLDAPTFEAFLDQSLAASWHPGPPVPLACNFGDGPQWIVGRNDSFAGVEEPPLAHAERYAAEVSRARAIHYEDLVRDPDASLGQVAAWFDLPPATPILPEDPVGYDVQSLPPGVGSVVWWVTMGCNFKCEYCWEVQAQKQGEFMAIKLRPWEEWLAVWRRLRPALLDVTGGEPFLLPGLEKVLAGLPETRFGLTTNLSHSLDELFRQVGPERFVQVTCSFHPTQGHRLPPELFLSRALRLLHRGYPVVINMVGWPDCLHRAHDWIGHFQHHGFRVHFDPYWSIYQAAEFSPEEAAIAASLTGPDRQPPSLAELPQVLCSGGLEHLSVQPDGGAWRCILETQLGINPLGNVFDPAFTLRPAFACSRRRECPGCDRDKVRVVPV